MWNTGLMSAVLGAKLRERHHQQEKQLGTAWVIATGGPNDVVASWWNMAWLSVRSEGCRIVGAGYKGLCGLSRPLEVATNR